MALDSWTNEQVVDQLVSGYAWYGPTITYAFPTSYWRMDGEFEVYGFQPLGSTAQQSAKLAITTWDDLIEPSFTLTTSYADIEFGFSDIDVEYAHAYYPDSGSVWFSSLYDELAAPNIGGDSFLTYVHEIGHALGLDHMGDYNGGGDWTPSSFEDSTLLSVMSYFGPSWGFGALNGEGLVAWADWIDADGWLYSPQTPMVNDIMAIQAIYGADPTTRTGNTVYGFGSNIGGALANLYNFTLNRNPILAIYDAGGIDTLNLSGWTTASTIDLAPGAYSSCNSMTYNIAIAYTCDIENAVGGAGHDTIRGNLLANRLDGGAGSDLLYGMGGNDVLNGGAGSDAMDGGEGSDIYLIERAADHTTAEFIDDSGSDDADNDEIRFAATVSGTLVLSASTNGVENVVIGTGTGASAVTTSSLTLNVNASAVNHRLDITGNAGNNQLTGTAFDDLLDGGAGADLLDGGLGADFLRGGKGNDTYLVDQAGDVIVEDLSALQGGGVDLVRSALSFDL
ncbi:MAG TPA: M10 family metallopeptidase, partial [Azonexus sp.]